MKCWICGKEMENTIGGCYHCKDCGVGIDDLVFRYELKIDSKPKKYNPGAIDVITGIPYQSITPFLDIEQTKINKKEK